MVMAARPKPKVTLEEYIDFHGNPQNADTLTINHLNQIIAMHGFIKLHNRPKKDLIDAIKAIDHLMPPLRSTLNENVSSCAFLTLEQVKEDLAALGWQECPVQSIETLKSGSENLLSADRPVICGSPTSDRHSFQPLMVGHVPVKVRKSRSKRRKTKELKTVIDSPAVIAAASSDVSATAATAASIDAFPDAALPPSPWPWLASC